MIEYIRGEVAELTPTLAVIDCQGVGYGLNISLTTYSTLAIGREARLYVYEAIREDAHLLYGFIDRRERELFLLLISVSGVGPNTARMILSSLSPTELGKRKPDTESRKPDKNGIENAVITHIDGRVETNRFARRRPSDDEKETLCDIYSFSYKRNKHLFRFCRISDRKRLTHRSSRRHDSPHPNTFSRSENHDRDFRRPAQPAACRPENARKRPYRNRV